MHTALGFYFSDFTPEVAWKAITITNMNATAADVKLYALGNSSILGCRNISIASRSKDVGLYTKWFPYVNFSDIKEIVAVSAAPLCGVSISGNGGNSFLLFTSAADAVGFNPVFDCSAPKPEAIGTIGKDGGIIEVKDPDSPIYGAKLVIPEGAIEENISFKINIPDNDDLPFPVGLESVSRAIEFLPEGIQYGGQGAKLYIPLTNPEEFESVDDIWVLTNESGSDRWTFEANVSLGENKRFIVVETTHNSSKKAVKKPKIDFSESVLSDEIFNLKSDAFPAYSENNTCRWRSHSILHGILTILGTAYNASIHCPPLKK